jgi:hypothetical protein
MKQVMILGLKIRRYRYRRMTKHPLMKI